MAHKFLKFSELRRDPLLQSRVAMDPELIGEYTDAILRGDRMPHVSVVFDRMYYYLVDGWHRCAALEAAGKCEVEANVVNGTYRDAQLASFAANSKNGARRTNADKRLAVERMLADEEWAKCSDNDIAKHCAVSQPFVSSVRSSLITALSDKPLERTYTTKHGTQATMRTASIGRKARTKRGAEIEQSATPATPAQPWPFLAPPIDPTANPTARDSPDVRDDEQAAAPEVHATAEPEVSKHNTEIEELMAYIEKLEAENAWLRLDLDFANGEIAILHRKLGAAALECEDVNYRTRQADGVEPRPHDA
ncbi:hypothetical protein [Paraburkholderia elongata]|uniref:ParB-like N-terminal domain-containing protein n=1 Tax=Paraburkholderia elongata TaxID=2675747 RepID=A0A972SNE3_9BURK|nr:hypothetical protein [Paraburkholderia elongata]NPT61214.1 hypothetical protein [Paraburkholderia elongata]